MCVATAKKKLVPKGGIAKQIPSDVVTRPDRPHNQSGHLPPTDLRGERAGGREDWGDKMRRGDWVRCGRLRSRDRRKTPNRNAKQTLRANQKLRSEPHIFLDGFELVYGHARDQHKRSTDPIIVAFGLRDVVHCFAHAFEAVIGESRVHNDVGSAGRQCVHGIVPANELCALVQIVKVKALTQHDGVNVAQDALSVRLYRVECCSSITACESALLDVKRNQAGEKMLPRQQPFKK